MPSYLMLNSDSQVWRLPRDADINMLEDTLSAAVRNQITVRIGVEVREGTEVMEHVLEVDGSALDWWTVVSREVVV